MTEGDHSFGPTCVFYEDEHDTLPWDGLEPPPVRAQFFYTSSLPIDDPLSPLPPIQADKTNKQPPKPFSFRDNAALEEAWQGLQKGQQPASKSRSRSRPRTREMFSFPKFRAGLKSPEPSSPRKEQNLDGTVNLEADLTMLARHDSEVMLSQTPRGTNGRPQPIDSEELHHAISVHALSQSASETRRQHVSHLRSFSRDKSPARDGPRPDTSDSAKMIEGEETQFNAAGMSGRPFARAPSKRNIGTAMSDGAQDLEKFPAEDGGRSRSLSPRRGRRKDKQPDRHKVFVPVGVSRLHVVELPDMVMNPIYWSPINDTSNVVRATWFYADTMLPVPADIANRLEVGYEYIKPYSASYQDELQACVEHGAAAEMRVVHRLWSDRISSSRPNSATDNKLASDVVDENMSVVVPQKQENAAADPAMKPSKRLFGTHSVIYVDRMSAQILRPSLLPSVRQNRRPLNSIRKGRQIGIAVVRGFDGKAWLKLHPDPKTNATAAHAKAGAYMSQSGDATTRGRRMSCPTCENGHASPKVSDLVLVIHGIGQKLSERVDSFHFTHAINGLRRDFNVELSSEALKGNLEKDSGIMVLPVNWRLNVSFEDEPKDGTGQGPPERFELKDITPDSLPAVRSIISDVMLDIPYYMSHHKDKMTSAVIREANRVYRLWCRNNPGFQENGRVHLIAHSLGSVMAMEILSKQPTRVPKDTKLDAGRPSEAFFEFDTTNLFCCGSPGGFFLLLNNARLIPRRGRSKPGMESSPFDASLTADASYGCLAVDNIYNICHRNDPISYLVNASVDPVYAASLQPAYIPSTMLSFLSRMGTSLRLTAGISSDAYFNKSLAPSRPPMQSMPSTVEMETHNFTREEVADKRMYLLNDNGQLDYYLSSSGGPLEIQYLSMLSAHSSYWISPDFARFLVVEIGRKPGRQNTVPVLRAVKKREWKRGELQ